MSGQHAGEELEVDNSEELRLQRFAVDSLHIAHSTSKYLDWARKGFRLYA